VLKGSKIVDGLSLYLPLFYYIFVPIESQ